MWCWDSEVSVYLFDLYEDCIQYKYDLIEWFQKKLRKWKSYKKEYSVHKSIENSGREYPWYE